MSQLPNLLSVLRLPLAVAVFLTVVEGSFGTAGFVFALAGLTDLADGRLARKLGVASALGGVLDHSSDAVFVTAALSGFAVLGSVPWLLPILIPIAFLQYAVDSRVWTGLALRASFLGRWNGIGYFVLAGYAIGVEGLGGVLGAEHWLGISVRLIAWLLVVSTVLSMMDRLVAVVRAQ